MTVTVTGRDEEGSYLLSTVKVERPKDWSALEKAFAEHRAIGGVVTEVVKGGLRVDVGAKAFMPASRSGARDLAEMEKLVGQEIQCQDHQARHGDRRRGGGPPRLFSRKRPRLPKRRLTPN